MIFETGHIISFMTDQEPNYLIFNGKMFAIIAVSDFGGLYQFLRDFDLKGRDKMLSSAHWRGFIATFKVDEKLSLHAFLFNSDEDTEINGAKPRSGPYGTYSSTRHSVNWPKIHVKIEVFE